MIQFLLCTLIGVMAFALFRTWSTSLTGLHKALDGALQIPIACDVLHRDLQMATPANIEIESERCIIKDAHRRIIWQFKKGTLTRAVSNFDAKGKRWKKSVKSVAAERAKNVRFSPLKSSDTPAINGIKLMTEQDQVLCIISLRRGKTL